MNFSNVTCQIDVFAENHWAHVGSLVPYVVGWVYSVRWVYQIWNETVNPSKKWNIFNILHTWLKIMVGFKKFNGWLI